MKTEVAAVPALRDNYVWMIQRGETAVAVDPGDARPVRRWLERHALRLTGIAVTHHHADHTGGVPDLLPCLAPGGFVATSAGARFPNDRLARSGETLRFPGGVNLAVLAVPGHTRDHVAYVSDEGHLFPGDTLFSMGCGRLFEGSAAEMVESLARLRALEPVTTVYPAHEYTAANLAFALDLEPTNDALLQLRDDVLSLRRQGRPTLPVPLARERALNPFLRLDDPAILRAVRDRGGPTAPDPVAIFATLRGWKDCFVAREESLQAPSGGGPT
jgi:hydroxyacylglutathione hydrolase